MYPRTTCTLCGGSFLSRNKLFQHLPACRDAHSDSDESQPNHAFPPSSLATNQVIERVNLFEDGSAYVLFNILSEQECQHFIASALALGLSDCGYSSRIRKTDRVTLCSQDVASKIFDRVAPFLDATFDLSHGSLCNGGVRRGYRTDLRPGAWKALCLNDHFRICRYEGGGFFLPHYDGSYDAYDDICSIQTFMLYLNSHGDDFEGGATRFYNEGQSHYKEGDPEKMVASYLPRVGSALVFNHNITHDGELVRSGEKYIMRSELMCRLGRGVHDYTFKDVPPQDWPTEASVACAKHTQY